MTWMEIAGTILLPAAISFGVSIYSSTRQKALEFNYDYRKYILERRKQAYIGLESYFDLIMSVDKKTLFYAGEGISHFIKDPKVLVWVSPRLKKKIEDFNMFIYSLSVKARPHDPDANEYAYGDFLFDYDGWVHEIEQIFFNDLMTLDDIERFRKERDIENSERTRFFSP